MRAEETESRGMPVAPYGSVGWHQQWPCLRDRSPRMASVIFFFGADGLHILVSRVLHRNFTWILEQWDIPLCTVPQIASRKGILGNREGGKKAKIVRLVGGTSETLTLGYDPVSEYCQLCLVAGGDPSRPFQRQMSAVPCALCSFGSWQHVDAINRDCLLGETIVFTG